MFLTVYTVRDTLTQLVRGSGILTGPIMGAEDSRTGERGPFYPGLCSGKLHEEGTFEGK